MRTKASWALLAFLAWVLRGLEASAGPVLFWDADPFLVPGARVTGTAGSGDWSSEAEGIPGLVSVRVERFLGEAGLGAGRRETLPTIPRGTRFVLVNQIASDIAFFDFTDRRMILGDPADVDGNGMPDTWEIRFLGANGKDPEADLDGDGFSNLAEFEAGTSPNDAASRPEMPGAMAWWRGDGDARDALGGREAVWIGAPDYREGRLARAFHFSGTNHVYASSAAVPWSAGRGITLAAWVRLNAMAPNGSPVVSCPGRLPGLPAVELLVTSQGPRLWLNSAGYSSLQGPVMPLSTGVWYHVAAAWNPPELRMYLNGKLAWLGTANVNGPLNLPQDPGIYVGHDGARRFWEGDIDEVWLLDRALGSDPIRWLAGGNAGPRGAVPPEALVVEREDQTLWRHDAGGGNGRFLTHGFDARLSPDRSRLLFRRAAQDIAALPYDQLVVRDLPSGVERVVRTVTESRGAVGYDWLPDGSGWVQASQFSQRIERWSVSGGEGALLVDCRMRNSQPFDPSVNPVDGALAWVETANSAEAGGPWMAEASGVGAASIPGLRLSEVGILHRYPSWSPDGTRLVLRAGRNLVIAARNGMGRGEVTTFEGAGRDPVLKNAAPVWTTDGREIAALVMDPDGSGSHRVAYFRADGTGAVGELALVGAPLAALLSGGRSGAAGGEEIRLRVEWVGAAVGGRPRLRLAIPQGGIPVVLEETEDLGSGWRNSAPVLREEGGQRFLEVQIPEGRSWRFYRVRR